MKIIFVQKEKAPPGFEQDLNETHFKSIVNTEFLNMQRKRSRALQPDETYFRISKKSRGEIDIAFSVGMDVFSEAKGEKDDRANILMDERDALRFIVVFSPNGAYKMSCKNSDVYSFSLQSPSVAAHSEYASNVSKKCTYKIIGPKKIFIDATHLRKEVIPHECT